jgi:hypothetical protein
MLNLFVINLLIFIIRRCKNFELFQLKVAEAVLTTSRRARRSSSRSVHSATLLRLDRSTKLDRTFTASMDGSAAKRPDSTTLTPTRTRVNETSKLSSLKILFLLA